MGEKLRAVQAHLRSVLQSSSDAFHLSGVELSEWERQKDDCYLQATSGNTGLVVDRPTDDETVMFKNTSALDSLAATERSRLKDLGQISGKRDRPRQNPQPDNKKPKAAHASKSEQAKRKAQSDRDKKAAASKRAKTEKPKTDKPKPKNENADQ